MMEIKIFIYESLTKPKKKKKEKKEKEEGNAVDY